MQSSARQEYLKTQVMTAAPQKLQLMLIDAAILSGRKTKEKWDAGEDDLGFDHLIHCQEVIGELLASVGSAKSKVADKLAGIYLFLFRSLSEVNRERNVEKLEDVLRVLAVERETWSQVCEQYGTTRDDSSEADPPALLESLDTRTNTSPQQPAQTPRTPTMPPLDLTDSNFTESGGISFEA